ncbi:hypothetical protein [Nocardioides solisilvae]|uniref:hypothetical protein n=1 Tax=Nocardioides solisilvae TaxID=1542435 RepID=UPI0013A5599C|nr:hypothetical protein [Nocardioides solisilvae]
MTRTVARPWVRTAALDLWPVLLSVVLCWPLLVGRGIPLARDLVFVPRQPFTDDALGLGDVAPRAVPLDAVVSLLTLVVDGGVLAKVLVPGLLALAGCGVHRALRGHGTVARVGAAGLAVWNPWTVERLALGQWALLAAYAALPFVAVAVVRLRLEGSRRELARTTLWTALASLTPTGGLLAVLTVLALGVGRARRTWAALGLAVALQSPWVVAGFTGAAGLTSDPDGVGAFAARADGAGHVLLTLVGLGGIWDARSVPATREAAWATATAVLVLVVLAVGLRLVGRRLGRGELLRRAAPAVLGLVLAALSTTGPGETLLRFLVVHVPGAGLLRDSQKFLAPYVLAVCLLTGVVLAAASRRLEARTPGTSGWLVAVALLGPLVLLPDAPTRTWPTVTPVQVPVGFHRVADLLAEEDGPCRVVSLPWRSYRYYPWGSGETSSDLALRLLDCDVVADDTLRVGDVVVDGESALVRDLRDALAAGPPAEQLGQRGVGWVLVQQDDPEAAALDLTGLDQVYADAHVALYSVPKVKYVSESVPMSRRYLSGFATLVTFLAVGQACASLVTVRRRSRSAAAADEAP